VKRCRGHLGRGYEGYEGYESEIYVVNERKTCRQRAGPMGRTRRREGGRWGERRRRSGGGCRTRRIKSTCRPEARTPHTCEEECRHFHRAGAPHARFHGFILSCQREKKKRNFCLRDVARLANKFKNRSLSGFRGHLPLSLGPRGRRGLW